MNFLYKKLTTSTVKWNESDEKKFEEVKAALIRAPVLTLPDMNKPFQLSVDVLNQTVYGILTQD